MNKNTKPDCLLIPVVGYLNILLNNRFQRNCYYYITANALS